MKLNPQIAVTMGDPSGIGPEIAIKVLSENKFPILIYGNLEILLLTAEKLKRKVPTNKIVNTINLTKNEFDKIEYSSPSALTGKIAFSAIESAVKDCINKKTKALVTGPISKLALKLAGHDWPGHTELLSYLSNPDQPPNVRMILLDESFLIVLNSVHISLKEAILSLNQDSILKTIQITNDWIESYNIINPRFWLSALNPHAGESGLLGKEEIEVLEPALKKARKKGINIHGPFPADTLFMQVKKMKKKFPPSDIIISLYHDQALIPFKLDGLDNGVNLTAGLPFLRTSVDHGTAFDIAGKGIASEIPLSNAIFKTQQLVNRLNDAK
ncbi:MAG: 4-hydroxythreonine-4-phosphate dehydrogenase PdxA [Betaproteobacteria bacterium TMED156]|nr:MAG: 4-hydroxythreonine-4-phosphate dehydrogenase PdxA [Betaproteobacteria bacterium TMED156]